MVTEFGYPEQGPVILQSQDEGKAQEKKDQNRRSASERIKIGQIES